MAKFGVLKRRILMVGGEGISLFLPTARGVERSLAVSWEAPDFDSQLLEELTERNRDMPVMLLFNAADQTYRKEENIPKLSPIDRSKYIQRKLEQAFPSLSVRASFLVKPNKVDPPYYLFVGLPETERLDRIAEVLLEAGVPVSGFGLLPLESISLVETLSAKAFEDTGRKAGWSVLITQHETGGLRQIVSRGGQLALTRITPATEAGASGPGWAEDVIREFKATLTYIARFGYIPEEGLNVVVACGALEKEFFTDKSLPVTNFRCVTAPEAFDLIGARAVTTDENSFGDALHAAWAARQSKVKNPVPVPSLTRIMMPRTAAWYGAIALFVLFLGLAGYVVSEYASYAAASSEADAAEKQQAEAQAKYDTESKAFDGLEVKPDLIRGTLKLKQTVDNGVVDIAPVLHGLHSVLDPDMRVKEISFTHDAGPWLKAETPSTAAAAASTPVAPPKPGEERGTMDLRFKFTLPDSVPLETKLQRAEALLQRLKTVFPADDVRIVTPFGNVTAGGSFTSDIGAGDAGKQEDVASEFEIKGPPL